MWRGVVVHGSAIVVDDLDVVPVGVEDERAVVARVVHGALARPAVVLVSGGERAVYHPGYYGAFVLDPDGHNVEVVNHNR